MPLFLYEILIVLSRFYLTNTLCLVGFQYRDFHSIGDQRGHCFSVFTDPVLFSLILCEILRVISRFCLTNTLCSVSLKYRDLYNVEKDESIVSLS